MNEDKTFFDELSADKGDPFEGLDKEETVTPSESSPENNDEVAKPEEGEHTPEKQVPFHEHPRWKEREKELEELRAFREEASSKLAEIDSRQNEDNEVQIPRWFSTLYGENSEAWEAYQEHSQEEREQLKRETIESMRQEQVQAVQEEQKWVDWVEDGVARLQAEGKTFDKNELLKAVIDYGFTDETGNYDFGKAYNFLEATKGNRQNPQTEAKKRVADISSSGRSGESSKKDFMTQKDLRHKSWSSL